MKRSLLLIFVAQFAALSTLPGCKEGSALPDLMPPVEITYRPSMVGIGIVIQVNNKSSHHLYNVTVVGRNFESNSSGSVKVTEHLQPWTAVEVGWMEFGCWVPVTGETVEVYCDGYPVPKPSIIPDMRETVE